MLSKINISDIIINHTATLKNDNTKKTGIDDYFTFLLIPIILTSILLYFKVVLSDEALNIVITTLSIFVGLLFNVIVLIFDIIKRDSTKKVKNVVLKELLANISFTILISIIAIIFTVLTFINNDVAKMVFTGLVYFLLSIFVFTVLMVLKRMHKLFNNEIDEIERNGNS